VISSVRYGFIGDREAREFVEVEGKGYLTDSTEVIGLSVADPSDLHQDHLKIDDRAVSNGKATNGRAPEARITLRKGQEFSQARLYSVVRSVSPEELRLNLKSVRLSLEILEKRRLAIERANLSPIAGEIKARPFVWKLALDHLFGVFVNQRPSLRFQKLAEQGGSERNPCRP
jgi:hypothetical protein